MAPQAPHGDIALEIGHQVEHMIMQAKQDSEVRVKRDLSVAKSQLQHMEGLINDLSERVANCARSADPSQSDPSKIVDRAHLSQKVAQLEQKWGSEVKALKQDLHRTILAHNHNSDLMRIHRDALDDARKKLDARASPTTEMFDQQTQKIENTLRAGHAKQRALDALAEQLAQLEAQVEDVLGGSAASAAAAAQYQGMMMPHLAGPNPSLVAHMTQQAREPPAAKAAAKRAPKKEEGPPTEDEVRARLLHAARSAGGGVPANDGSGFNVEAPAFVPGGAAAAATSKLGGGYTGGSASGGDNASGDEGSDAAGGADDDAADGDDGLEDLANIPPPPGI